MSGEVAKRLGNGLQNRPGETLESPAHSGKQASNGSNGTSGPHANGAESLLTVAGKNKGGTLWDDSMQRPDPVEMALAHALSKATSDETIREILAELRARRTGRS